MQIIIYMKWIYGVFEGYIQQYSPETEVFFRPRPQAEDGKIPRLRGYTDGYSTKTHRISNIYSIIPPIVTITFRRKMINYETSKLYSLRFEPSTWRFLNIKTYDWAMMLLVVLQHFEVQINSYNLNICTRMK